jgi:hypothetical protein
MARTPASVRINSVPTHAGTRREASLALAASSLNQRGQHPHRQPLPAMSTVSGGLASGFCVRGRPGSLPLRPALRVSELVMTGPEGYFQSGLRRYLKMSTPVAGCPGRAYCSRPEEGIFMTRVSRWCTLAGITAALLGLTVPASALGPLRARHQRPGRHQEGTSTAEKSEPQIGGSSWEWPPGPSAAQRAMRRRRRCRGRSRT